MKQHQNVKGMQLCSKLKKKIFLYKLLANLFFFIRSQKENLKMAEAAEEQRLLRVQKNYIELEMRKFKRKKLCSLHDLENQLLRDVSLIRNFFKHLEIIFFLNQ